MIGQATIWLVRWLPISGSCYTSVIKIWVIIFLGNEVINAENEEKDLGVIVIDTLKPSSQCIAAAKSAKKTLGIIKKIFVNRDSEIISKLYQSLVRPKLEYCVQAWRPYLNKGNDLLEKVQNRATQTRLMTKDRSLSYEERLQRLGHLPYITGDQKTTRRSNWSLFTGFDNIIIHTVFHYVRYRT